MSTTLIRPPQTLVPPQYIQLLCNTITQCVEQNIAGDVIEIGVYKGGSLFRMAQHAAQKHPQAFASRRIIGIDTFAGHPYHDPQLDPAHHFTGRFADTSYEVVRDAMSGFGFVDVLRGECEDVFKTFAEDQKFCLANVDVDVAESAMRCTRYLFSRLSVGGVMIFDEYQGYGQKSLLDEFFRDKPVQLVERSGLASGNYGLIVKKLAAT